jgi:hypothetical protein
MVKTRDQFIPVKRVVTWTLFLLLMVFVFGLMWTAMYIGYSVI